MQDFQLLHIFYLYFMSRERRTGSHTTSWLTAHIVWVTKYRYKVLTGDIQSRCRDLVRQICDADDVRILKGVVSQDHVHLHVEYRPSLALSDLVKRLKGRSSRRIQEEFPEIGKRYWGRHFWAIGYGIWSTGNITDEMVKEYLEHHRKPDTQNDDNFILE